MSSDHAPDLAQKQSKTVDGTAMSFFKGGMGIALRNLANSSSLGRRNAERLLRKAESNSTGQQRDSVVEPTKSEDDMRIDSDDIHYHILPSDQKPQSGLGSIAAKLIGTAMIATGIGAPLGIGLTMAPDIIRALKGDNPHPVASPVDAEVAPAPPNDDSPIAFGLRVGKPD